MDEKNRIIDEICGNEAAKKGLAKRREEALSLYAAERYAEAVKIWLEVCDGDAESQIGRAHV